MTDETATLANDDTREKLLNAAHSRFAERGFHGASIALIAGEVGLTKQALLYHFKRKDDLYREVILDHYRSPRNQGELETPPATSARH